jgi:hypothetical protein
VPAGTTYTWSAPIVTGGITGGAAGTNQASITGTFTNPTNTAQTATYTVTPSSGCTGATFTITVTVNPLNHLLQSTSTTCGGTGSAVTPANGSGNIVPAGTTYTWSAATVTGGMTGGSSGHRSGKYNRNAYQSDEYSTDGNVHGNANIRQLCRCELYCNGNG